MTWQTTNRTPATWANDPGITGQQQTALAGLAVPADLATAGALASSADATATRAAINAARQPLATAAFWPWSHGTRAEGRIISHSLTPQWAQDLLATAAAGQAAVIAILISADTPAQLAEKLASLQTAMPNTALAQAERIARALASHDTERAVITADARALTATDINQPPEHQSAAAVISLTEAIASDTDPAAMLAEFASHRAARHTAQAAAMTAPAGPVEHAIYLDGDITSQLAAITPPDTAAPYSGLLALFGTADALAPLKQELNL